MEKYESPEMEVVEFETEDVLINSPQTTYVDDSPVYDSPK